MRGDKHLDMNQSQSYVKQQQHAYEREQNKVEVIHDVEEKPYSFEAPNTSSPSNMADTKNHITYIISITN